MNYACGNHPSAQRYYPALEATPDLRRGEQRLAAEVALAHFRGMFVPESAHQRATVILKVMALG